VILSYLHLLRSLQHVDSDMFRSGLTHYELCVKITNYCKHSFFAMFQPAVVMVLHYFVR